MSYYLRLTDTLPSFEKKILGAVKDEFNRIFKQIVNPVRQRIAPLVSQAVASSPEVQSMLGGSLQGDLGFINPQRFVNALLKAISAAVKVEFDRITVSGNTLRGGLSVHIFEADYSELLNIPEASYQSGIYEIPWLKWLILEGNNIIVADYHIEFGSFPQSRSKKAVMKKRGSYRIPAEFAGNEHNNFITRSLEIIDDQIDNIIQQEIDKI
jgi:hypothetical protein